MPKSIISEGKTTNEAIEAGLKKLHVSKDAVEIKVLEEEDKRSFFSILTPRVVKVELTLKENYKKEEVVVKEQVKREVKPINSDSEEIKKAIENIKSFLNEWIDKLPVKDVKYDIKVEDYYIRIDILGEDVNFLIGYRGDVLNSLQVLLSSIANKGIEEKVRILLDIQGYRQKREKTLEELADKLAKTVTRTRKSITLEPMTSYERKIIHSRLQDNLKVKTESIGEEPYRKVVISLK